MLVLAPTQPITIIQNHTHKASILAITPDMQVCIVQSPNKDGSLSWKLPHYSITDKALAKEETATKFSGDTALTVTSQGLFYLGLIAEDATQHQIYFHKTGQVFDWILTPQEESGFAVMRWVGIYTLQEGIRSNHVTDPATVSAFTKAKVAHVL